VGAGNLTHWRVSLYHPQVATNLKLDDKLVRETVKLGHFRSKREAVNSALAEFVQRRQRLRILELAGQIDFDPEWDYKRMRGNRS
jgi:Arc/MetJ family transcription regulator